MLNVLQKLHIQEVYMNFEKEKITPDIVCKLSSGELDYLGISTRARMMKLRTECTRYGISKPNRDYPENGRPQFEIPKFVLQNLIENGFLVSDIAKLLSVSESILYRRMAQFGLSKMNFADISDNDLDLQLGEIKNFLYAVKHS